MGIAALESSSTASQAQRSAKHEVLETNLFICGSVISCPEKDIEELVWGQSKASNSHRLLK
jgi:hypothetical protein